MQNMKKEKKAKTIQAKKSQVKKEKTHQSKASQVKKEKSSQNMMVCAPSCREPNGSRTIVPRTKRFVYHCAEPPVLQYVV